MAYGHHGRRNSFQPFMYVTVGVTLTRENDAQEVARIARTQWSCGLGGIVVTCPIPEHYALETGPLEKAIQAGLQQAQEQGYKEPHSHPLSSPMSHRLQKVRA